MGIPFLWCVVTSVVGFCLLARVKFPCQLTSVSLSYFLPNKVGDLIASGNQPISGLYQKCKYMSIDFTYGIIGVLRKNKKSHSIYREILAFYIICIFNIYPRYFSTNSSSVIIGTPNSLAFLFLDDAEAISLFTNTAVFLDTLPAAFPPRFSISACKSSRRAK